MAQAHHQEHLDDNFPRVTDSTIEAAKYRTHFHKSAYKDDDVVKIGWGTSTIRGKSIQASSVCEKTEADEWLKDDLIHCGNVVKLNCKPPMTQDEFDNMTAIVYKIGELKFLETIDAYKSEQPQVEDSKDEINTSDTKESEL